MRAKKELMSQLYYAKQGLITGNGIYCHSENVLDYYKNKPKPCNANTGNSFGANTLKLHHPEFVRVKSPEAEPSFKQHQPSRKRTMIVGRNFLVKLMLISGTAPLPPRSKKK
jgi:hypothetical protein